MVEMDDIQRELDGFKIYRKEGKELIEVDAYLKMKSRAEGFRVIINEQSERLKNT